MLVQRFIGVAGRSFKPTASMAMGLKGFVCYTHTTFHIPKLNANMEDLYACLRPSKKENHDSSVIMLHGVGDTGFFLVPYAADLSRTFSNIKFVCPTGEINLTAHDSARVHAWFDFPSWDEDGNNKCVGVEQSVKIVNSLIEKEIKDGIDPSKIVLVGFSQGAGIALHTAYKQSKPLGGVISLCGCLPNDRTFSVSDIDKSTPLLMLHGAADNHVPVEFIRKTFEMLKEKGIENMELNVYPGVKHKITRRMMDLTRVFLEEKLGHGKQL